MFQSAFNHGFGARLAKPFQQMFFKRSRVHTNTHGTPMVLGRLHNFTHPIRRSNIPRIDPQTSRTGLSRFNGAFIMEMNVGHDRNRNFSHDLFERSARGLIRTRHAHDISARLFQLLDLLDSRLHVRRNRIRHRLHSNGRISADRHRSNMDLPALTTFNIAPRTNTHLIFPFKWGATP